jgi:hypothetical protein
VLALAATGKNDRLLLQRVKRILSQKNTTDRPGARPVLAFLFTLLAASISLSQPSGPIARFIKRNNSTVLRVASETPPATSKGLAFSKTTALRKTLPGDKQGNAFLQTTGTEDPGSVSGAESPNGEATDEQTIITSGDTETDDTIVEEVAAAVHPVQREYSFVQASAPMCLLAPKPDPATPFIPNESFSSGGVNTGTGSGQQLTELICLENSAKKTQEKILQELAVNEITIAKVQVEIKSGLEAIRDIQSVNQEQQIHAQERELRAQLRLRQHCLMQQQELQKSLQLAARKLRIVYI